MSSTSSPVKRFKIAFDATDSVCHPKPTKFFAIESKDGHIKGLKTRIQNKFAIDYDWDLMIDDIVVDDYPPVGIIGRDEVTVIRRKPITGHSNEAINDMHSIEVQMDSQESVTIPQILATNRPQKRRSEKRVRWLTNGSNGWTTSGEEVSCESSQSSTEEISGLIVNELNEQMNGSQSDGLSQERSRSGRLIKPMKLTVHVIYY